MAKSFGQVAYEANKKAWPPESLYVAWELLTQSARDGWELIATSVLEAYNDTR